MTEEAVIDQHIDSILASKIYLSGERFAPWEVTRLLSSRTVKIDFEQATAVLEAMCERDLVVKHPVNKKGRKIRYDYQRRRSMLLRASWRRHSNEQLGVEVRV